jgi:glycosyltransferase involved in cell wall biosynthesis
MVANQMKADYDVIQIVMPFESKGVLPRLLNALYCFFRQGDLNHITGDIHYVAILLSRQKTILTVHDCGALLETKGLKKLLLQYFWFTLPARCVSQITVISAATKVDLLQNIRFSEERIHIIHTCIQSIFEYVPYTVKHNPSTVKLLQLGTAPNKNIKRLAEGLEGLDVELTIVGKLNEETRSALDAYRIKYCSKEFRLSDNEVFHEYQSCDIVCFISTLEGFGMPIVEAQKVGRLVVTSAVSSMPEIAGEGAIFVDPVDVASIRKGFMTAIELLGEPYNLLEKGLRNALRFEPEAIAKSYAELYKGMLKTTKPHYE